MCEYTVYDAEKNDKKLVRAPDWREAVLRGAELGVVPRSHLDVRPRTGTCSAPRDIEEFNSFISKHF